MKKWPSEKELKKAPVSRIIGPHADAVEKAKFRLCELLVIYKIEHQMTQRELASKLGVNESIVSKILHYRFERFTIDKLLNYLSVIYRDIDLVIGVA